MRRLSSSVCSPRGRKCLTRFVAPNRSPPNREIVLKFCAPLRAHRLALARNAFRRPAAGESHHLRGLLRNGLPAAPANEGSDRASASGFPRSIDQAVPPRFREGRRRPRAHRVRAIARSSAERAARGGVESARNGRGVRAPGNAEARGPKTRLKERRQYGIAAACPLFQTRLAVRRAGSHEGRR